jgi:hypothetical protein
MQSSLFDMAPEPEAPALLPAEEFIDIFEDIPEPVKPAEPDYDYDDPRHHPRSTPFTEVPPYEPDLMAWCRKNHHDLILCDVVLRAKTIEANALCSAGPEAELKYLLEAYNGDEASLRVQILEVARVIRLHNLQPGYSKATDEMSL